MIKNGMEEILLKMIIIKCGLYPFIETLQKTNKHVYIVFDLCFFNYQPEP